jgi:ABC-2 type transport system permease protein
VTSAPLGGRQRSDHGSSIYDLGYRGYEGPRLGRRAAVGALLRHTLRTAYGLGRSARSKIMPVGLVLLATLPALLAVGVIVLFAQFAQSDAASGAADALSPVRYSTIFPFTAVLVFLFSAAQAPELFGRDQLANTLPLYFSRAISRSDYAVARMLGLLIALLVLVLAPQIILFIGRVLVAPDMMTGLGDELPQLPTALLVGFIIALVVGSLAAAIAALTPRRAYATVAIVAIFLIPNVFAAILVSLDIGLFGQLAVLLSPADVLDGVNAFLFDTRADNMTVRRADLDGWVYLAAAAAWTAGSLIVLLRRYQRLAT